MLITLLFLLAFAACKKSNTPGGTDFFSSDETKAAGDIIDKEVNADLKEVKKIYKDNQNRAKDLQDAMSVKDIDKVKAIAHDLVVQINSGIVLGESAISKIEKAQTMNINSTYKEYLGLKRDALRKQLDAFELRRQSAQALEQNATDEEGFKKAALILKVNEDKFQELMDEGKDLSQQANQIAKDAAKKQ